MLSNIDKAEIDERIRKIITAASVRKDSLAPKWKAPVEVSPVPSDQDEQTNLGLAYKRKRREASPPPPKHSNSDGRAPHQEVNRITEEDNVMLIGMISEEEVKHVVWICGSDKSSGLDSFNFGFIKCCWEEIK